MPIYEYKCRECDDQFEVIQKVSDRPLKSCKKCGGRLEKLLSQTSFVLRGGGWYSDGYGKAKPSTAPAKSPPEGSGGAASGGNGASSSGSTTKGASGGESASGTKSK